MPIVEIKSECARTEANKRIPIQSTDRKGRLCLLTTGGLIRVSRLATANPKRPKHKTNKLMGLPMAGVNPFTRCANSDTKPRTAVVRARMNDGCSRTRRNKRRTTTQAAICTTATPARKSQTLQSGNGAFRHTTIHQMTATMADKAKIIPATQSVIRVAIVLF